MSATKTTPKEIKPWKPARNTESKPVVKAPLAIGLALAAVMQDLKAVGKWGEMSQGGEGPKYKFRGIDDVVSALHPILAAHGVVIVPEILDFKHSFIAGKNSKGGAINISEVKVKYTLFGPLGDSVSGSSIGVSFDSSDKATSKAMTMAYKAWLCQTFVIATYDTEDADSYDPTVDPRSLASQGEDLTVLSDEVLESRIEAVKFDLHKASEAGEEEAVKACVARRNILEDEQNRREEEKKLNPPTKSEPAAAAKAPEKAARARKGTKPAPEAAAAQEPAKEEPSPSWKELLIPDCCPVAKYRGKKLGDLPPESVQKLKTGWCDTYAEKIALDPAKRAFAKVVLEANRELFPE